MTDMNWDVIYCSPVMARIRAWLWTLEVLGYSGREMVASTDDNAEASDD
jgi:hypothetical protein